MIINVMKYKILVIWPIISNGYSTGFAPIQVRMMNVILINQKVIFFIMLNFIEISFWFLKDKIIKIRMEATKAITPPSLLGIDRRMA